MKNQSSILKGREGSLLNLSFNSIYASSAIDKGGILNNAVSKTSDRLIEDSAELNLLEGNGSSKIDIGKMQEQIPGFTAIDKALSGILNNLSYSKSN